MQLLRPFSLVVASLVLALSSTALAYDRDDSSEPDDPNRPPAIETEDVPAVPDSVLERLEQYQSIRGAGFAGWAPSGDGILIRTRFGNSSQLHRVYQPGGRREQLTFYEEPVRGRFVPQSEHDDLLLTLSRGGDENDQIFWLDREDYRTVLLTDGSSRNRLGPVRQDGTKMAVSSNRRNGRDTDLYVADPRQPNSMKMVFSAPGEYWYAADWSPDGKQLLIARYVSINESYFALLNLETKKRTDLPLPGGEKAAIGDLEFSPDGKAVYLTTDAGSEFTRLARIDLESRQYEWLSEEINWDVADVEVSTSSRRIAFSVNEDGASRLFVLEGDQPRAIDLPLGILSDLDFSPDGSRLGFTLARPDAPADAYTLSLEDRQLTRWTFSETGGLDPRKFVSPERIQYPSFDGRQIPAYYYRPAKASADNKVPVLIVIHGGPESQYRPYFSGSTQYYVNEMGLAVVAPNVRGSSGYGKTYLKLDNAELREDSVKDIGALLDWIAEQDELDASRVAVSGGSYGGYMVLSSLTHFGDRLRAGIDNVGIANFITFLKNTAPYRQDLRRAEYGDERDPKMRAVFERINPTANADKIQSALLVIHGQNDPRVPFSEAQQIARIVRDQDTPVWTVYADNEGHGFGKKDNRDYARAVEVMFLEKYLLDR